MGQQKAITYVKELIRDWMEDVEDFREKTKTGGDLRTAALSHIRYFLARKYRGIEHESAEKYFERALEEIQKEDNNEQI